MRDRIESLEKNVRDMAAAPLYLKLGYAEMAVADSLMLLKEMVECIEGLELRIESLEGNIHADPAATQHR